ncbi:MAG: hypothetical protein JWP44_5013 [Mucilaginibacter sp.]|nr:hypothetical protein [Mucilaginibacter sp.]
MTTPSLVNHYKLLSKMYNTVAMLNAAIGRLFQSPEVLARCSKEIILDMEVFFEESIALTTELQMLSVFYSLSDESAILNIKADLTKLIKSANNILIDVEMIVYNDL